MYGVGQASELTSCCHKICLYRLHSGAKAYQRLVAEMVKDGVLRKEVEGL